MYVVPAEITEEVTDLLENETNPVTFHCQATGEPVPTISWYFNNTIIDVSNSSNYNVSNSLNGTKVTSTFTNVNVQSSNVGTYTCLAENIIGSGKSSGVLTVNGNILTYVHKYVCVTSLLYQLCIS